MYPNFFLQMQFTAIMQCYIFHQTLVISVVPYVSDPQPKFENLSVSMVRNKTILNNFTCIYSLILFLLKCIDFAILYICVIL